MYSFIHSTCTESFFPGGRHTRCKDAEIDVYNRWMSRWGSSYFHCTGLLTSQGLKSNTSLGRLSLLPPFICQDLPILLGNWLPTWPPPHSYCRSDHVFLWTPTEKSVLVPIVFGWSYLAYGKHQANIWPVNEYMNKFILSIFPSSPSSMLGWAVFPGPALIQRMSRFPSVGASFLPCPAS